MASLDGLPDDLKYLICVEVEKYQSVRPLWQTSRAWRAVAEAFIYRGISLTISSTEDGSIQGDRLLAEDFRGKYLKHARYIEIHPTRLKSRGFGPVAPTFSLTESDHPPFEGLFDADFREDPDTSKELWEPLVTVLPLFEHLSDIVLRVRGRFPPGLLAAIERHHPNCRLHLRNFRFKSLHDPVTDPDERALATSPNLHSLSVEYTDRDVNGVDDFNEAAVLHTVGLAPNLKHVRMLGYGPCNSDLLQWSLGKPVESWNGFVPTIVGSPVRKTKLKTLSFAIEGFFRPCMLDYDRFARWKEVVDFSQLKLFGCVTGDEGFLRSVALENKFPSLESLALSLRLPFSDQMYRTIGLQAALEVFFASLNPLQSLTICGTVEPPLFEVITTHHGSTLTKLSIDSHEYWVIGPRLWITPPVMARLDIECPKLTSLNLTIHPLKRPNPIPCEPPYHADAMGTLQELRKLRLSPDRANGDAWDLRSGEGWDNFLSRSYIPLSTKEWMARMRIFPA